MQATVEDIDVAKKLIDKGRCRIGVHLVGRADLFDLAVIHHHDTVGHFQRFFLIVGDEDAGDVHFVV